MISIHMESGIIVQTIRNDDLVLKLSQSTLWAPSPTKSAPSMKFIVRNSYYRHLCTSVLKQTSMYSVVRKS